MNEDWLEVDGLNIEFKYSFLAKDESVGIMSDDYSYDIMHVWIDNNVITEVDILPILTGENLIKVESEIENYLNKTYLK
jgi:hypothetical protein